MIDIREVEVKYRAILDSCFLHHDKISLFCMQKVSQKLGDMAGRAKAAKNSITEVDNSRMQGKLILDIFSQCSRVLLEIY